jgi:uncharacterized protein YijF (DUF1287 family)
LQAARHRLSAPAVPALRRWIIEARARVQEYHPAERTILARVAVPLLLLALGVSINQVMRDALAPLTTIATIDRPAQEIAALAPGNDGDLAAMPAGTLPPASEIASNAPLGPVIDTPPVAKEILDTGATLRTARPEPEIGKPAPLATAKSTTAMAALPRPAASAPETHSSIPAPEALASRRDRTGDLAHPVSPAILEAYDLGPDGKPLPSMCIATPRTAPNDVSATAGISLSPEAFGLRLAEAAEKQVDRFVIYNESYRRIAYPMGDVHEMYGVCTDVVVRAYRALGVDLQMLVHEARVGSGDPSIDHRRTEVLRRFFSARGESLPVSSYAEDYLPGDIVTYDRTHNRRSRVHIAVVSRVIAPSRRPMIVHNRGWGPQLEDALFVDRITGHYRYLGPRPGKPALRQASVNAAGVVSP